MNLRKRLMFPIIRDDGGLNCFHVSSFSDIDADGYTCNKTGSRYDFLEELKKSCRHGPSGVLTAFSYAQILINEPLEIGKITSVKVPEPFSKVNCVIIGAPNRTAIMGDVGQNECVFPHFQYKDEGRINISCSAFKECPKNFRPPYIGSVYLGLDSSDYAIKVLQKALWEFSQNNPDMAVIQLYSAIEIAIEKLTGKFDGKISVKIENYRERIKVKNPDLAGKIRNLKRRIEKYIVKPRGAVAHSGESITQGDLLVSFETALEFFWYYGDCEKY